MLCVLTEAELHYNDNAFSPKNFNEKPHQKLIVMRLLYDMDNTNGSLFIIDNLRRVLFRPAESKEEITSVQTFIQRYIMVD